MCVCIVGLVGCEIVEFVWSGALSRLVIKAQNDWRDGLKLQCIAIAIFIVLSYLFKDHSKTAKQM